MPSEYLPPAPPSALARVQRLLWSLLWIVLVLMPLTGAGLLFWADWHFHQGSSLLLAYLALACGLLSGPSYLLGKWLAKRRLEDADLQGCAELVLGGCLEGCASGFLVLLSLGVLVTLLVLVSL
jgi:hypothetical protein